MSTLITGGGSNTGVHLGHLLKAAGREAILASRSGNRIPEGFASVKLDWKDPSTFESALDASPTIEFVYIVGDPTNLSPGKDIIPFIEAAVKKKGPGGIKKFVYLSATTESEEGGLEEVPRYLEKNKIDHVILRPTWFIDNLAPTGLLMLGAHTKDQFETAVPTGRIPFVAAEDIGRAAFRAITEDIVNKDLIVLGPELLTYTELAAAASDALGRKITHKPMSAEDLLQVRGDWAKWLIDLEVQVETEGTEERFWTMSTEELEKRRAEIFKGKKTVREWVIENKAAFN